MRPVVVAGVGMTSFGKFIDRNVKSLVTEAISLALEDAGAAAPDVQFVFFANSMAGIMQGQESTRGQHGLRESGLQGVPTVNVENACASGATAFHQAWLAVASGYVDAALAVGVEKLHHPDKTRAFRALASAIDQDRIEQIRMDLGARDDSHSIFMDFYARLAQDYMERTGATQEDFARVAVKSHAHGALNPKAQYRNRLTVEEVLSARKVSGPLTVPMCAPVGDGAAAVLVCSSELAIRWGAEPVNVLATVVGSGREGVMGCVVPDTARAAFERSGVDPADIDVLECHDAASPAELLVLEELGICGPGEAPKLVRESDTSIGGRVPTNPSGGLVSKGHPIGATGIAQLVELCDQLRRRCGPRQIDQARVAVAENAGGYLGPDVAVATITVLAI